MKKIKTFAVKLKAGQRFTRLLGDPSKKGLRAGLVTLKPGESIGEHKTEHKEEVIVILNGSAIIYYGKNKKIKAPQNTFAYIAPETTHNVKNSGCKILQYIYVTAGVVRL
ncbi:MAG: cupin domain-containing protein [Candidatus Omnitrophota bacterium]